MMMMMMMMPSHQALCVNVKAVHVIVLAKRLLGYHFSLYFYAKHPVAARYRRAQNSVSVYT